MWDLDGLVSLDELNLNLSDIDLMIDKFKLTDLYSRQTLLCFSPEFTTTEEIFHATGLYKIMLSDCKVHLSGTTDVLYYYFDTTSNNTYDVELIDGVLHKKFMNLYSITLTNNSYYPKVHLCLSDNLGLDFLLNDYQVISVFELEDSLVLSKLFDLNLLVDVTCTRDLFSNQSLYYLSLLSEYCKKITICNLDLNNNIPVNFKGLLSSYPNIVLSSGEVLSGHSFSLSVDEISEYESILNNKLNSYLNQNSLSFNYLG